MLFSKLKLNLFFYCLTFLLLFSWIPVDAQQITGKVRGEVLDENHGAFPFVQVSLKHYPDSNTVKIVLADDKGHFAFDIPAGKYFIELKMMGYSTAYSRVFDIAVSHTQLLGAIQLKPAETQLAAVNIAASLPFVERRADKLIVNLNGLGSGAPIMEVMNQLPGVSVTPDDRISLNGKSVQIYIDGKISTLSAEALAGMLKGISSSSIQKVELIVQPSAKYDAAGSGAIINIIRKRNYKAGLNGNIYAGGGKGTFGKANGGINVNYKGKIYNALLNLDYNYNKYFYNSSITSDFLSSDGSMTGQTITDLQSTRTNANYTPSLGLDFYLTKRTTLSASIKPGFQTFNRDGLANIDLFNRIDAKPSGIISSSSQFINLVGIRAINLSSGLRLQYQIDTSGRELTTDLDYYRYGNFNDQDNRTITADHGSDIPTILRQDRILDAYAFKMDYAHPLTKGKQLEMGMKTSYVNSDNSNFFPYSVNQQTDLFAYKESISAAYMTYAANAKKISYQLGMRAEYTYGQGEQQYNANRFTRNYFQLFPSIHLDYKLTPNHNLSLGLNKKTERPDYESLNPLVRIISSSNLQQGNPELQPANVYNTDLWYGYKNSFFFGVTYSYRKDDFTSLAVPLTNDVVTTLPGNADYSDYATVQAMYGKQVLPWWYTSSNATLSKRSFKGEVNGSLLQSNGITSLSATSFNSFSLGRNFSVMFIFNYRGKSMDRTLTNKRFSYLTAGIRQHFLNKRASAQLNMVDIFKSYLNIYQQNSGFVQQWWRNQFETRMVKVNFSYSFGGTVKNTKKNSGAEEERKRSTLNEN